MSLEFNAKEYGAVADGKTLNTKAIQSAIDACHQSGGGTVTVNAGTYVTGSLDLKSNVELHLAHGCKILGSTNIDDYKDFISDGFHNEKAPEGTCKYLIGASHASNVSISGSGEINASGPTFFDHTEVNEVGKFTQKPPQRPRLLMMHRCYNIKISDGSFMDSPCWTFWLMQCTQVNIHRITIIGDPRMINNDGIDIDACKDVTISDCIMKTDDDCIVLRAIQTMYDTPAICENVVINNCTLESTCQCIRVSCPSDHIVRNCAFSNLTLKGRNGINFDYPNRYLAAGSKGGAEVRNISFSNVIIDSKGYPIRIEVAEGITLPAINGITFANMRINSQMACVLKGNESTTIEDVSFSNVQLTITGEQPIIARYCKGLKLNNVEFNSQSD